MGFLKNFFKGSPAKIITNAILPGLPLGLETIKAVTPLAQSAFRSIQPLISAPRTNAQQNSSPYYVPGSPTSGPAPQYNVTYSAPAYGGGGSYDAYSYQPQVDPWGVTPWASSMTSLTPLARSYPVYSPTPPNQDRTWEDLALAALPFFL